MCVCIYVYMYVFMDYVVMYVCMQYVYNFVYVYVCMYVCVPLLGSLFENRIPLRGLLHVLHMKLFWFEIYEK